MSSLEKDRWILKGDFLEKSPIYLAISA